MHRLLVVEDDLRIAQLLTRFLTSEGFVVLNEGATLSEDDAKTHVKEHLARHKVPRDVIFLDEIPRNPTGKVLKRVLREMGEG